jgi:sulfite exporter TauE/SafE
MYQKIRSFKALYKILSPVVITRFLWTGDLVTILTVGIIGNKLSTAKRSSLFAVGGIIAMVFMIWLSSCLKHTNNPNDKEVKVTGNSEVGKQAEQ